jgi:DNA-binding transcriptional regulator YhcF (GntR family)
VRVLAHQVSISKNTVQRAYNELVAQGLLENKKRIGLFLAPPQKKIKPLPHTTAAALAIATRPPPYHYPQVRDPALKRI